MSPETKNKTSSILAVEFEQELEVNDKSYPIRMPTSLQIQYSTLQPLISTASPPQHHCNITSSAPSLWRSKEREKSGFYRCPAVSAHSLLPICTNREHALANANTSSSPVNIELLPTVSVDNPYFWCEVSFCEIVSPSSQRIVDCGTRCERKKETYQIVHYTSHMI
jgi:hypothetical protein